MRVFAMGLVGGALVILRLTGDSERILAAIGPVAALVAVIAGVFGFTVWSRERTSWLLLASLGVSTGALAVLMSCQAAAGRVIDESLVGQDIVVEGQVLGVPQRDGRRLAFEFAVESSRVPGTGAQQASGATLSFAPKRLRLSHYGSLPLAAGERWRLTVRLRPVSGLRNAGGFDRIRFLLARRIDATGSVRAQPAPVQLPPGHAGFSRLSGALSAWRERRAEQLVAIARAHHPEPSSRSDGKHLQQQVSAEWTDSARLHQAAALTQALILGLDDGLAEDVRARLRDTGTAHLLAISGLHVSLVAGWGFWLGSRLLRRCGGSRARAAGFGTGVSLLLATLYALVAGFELPVRRALAMLAIGLVALFRCRAIPPGGILAAALVAAFAIDPLAPLSIGFWLSFGTVGTLVWLHAGHLRPRRAGATRRLLAIAAVFRTHVLLGLLMLPVSAWFFQSGAWSAPLANIIAVPLVGALIVPLAFMAVLLSGFAPSLAAHAMTALGRVADLLFSVLDTLLNVSGGAGVLVLPSIESLLWCLLGMAVLVAPRGVIPRHLALVLLLPALLANTGRSSRVEGFELHVLDVGQGLAALILTPQETWLYDTGGMLAPGLSMLEVAVVPYLQSLGRRDVDVIVVSHPDSDHAAGLDDALHRWPNARVIVGVSGGKMPEKATNCVAGSDERHDGIRFAFLHPAAHDQFDENDSSCVMLVQLGASRVLLTGDIERMAEWRLAHRVEKLSVTAMTAPHHGSRTSSSAALLAAFTPAHVVFPAGYRNKYGFPHADVEMRYKNAGAVSHVTARDGAVRFAFGPSGLAASPSSWHATRLRFWHDMLEP